MVQVKGYPQIVSVTKVMCDETLGYVTRSIDLAQDARGTVIITATDNDTVRRYAVQTDGEIKNE